MLMLAPAGACRAADLLESVACRGALDALQAQEAATLADPEQPHDGAAPRAALARLADARQAAARACLGGSAEAPLQQRQAQDPVTVPRVVVKPVPLPAPLPIAPAVPPRVASPPVTVIGCDATGCWASDGSHLLRAGPGGLLGPRGRCRVQGTVLHCP